MSRHKSGKTIEELRKEYNLSSKMWKLYEHNKQEAVFVSTRGRRRTISRF